MTSRLHARILAAMDPFLHRLSALGVAALVLPLVAACQSAPETVPSGGVLFQDDFSRSSSGWETRRETEAILEYREGEYVILVLAPHASVWSTPGIRVGEVRVEVDARLRSGSPNNLFGVVCRYQDDDHFSFLILSSDGFAGIGEVEAGRRSLLSGEAMLPAEAIAPGSVPNHVTAECLSDVLRLSVNGSLVAEVASQARTPEGDVGLMVGSYEQPGVELAFDNFSARAP